MELHASRRLDIPLPHCASLATRLSSQVKRMQNIFRMTWHTKANVKLTSSACHLCDGSDYPIYGIWEESVFSWCLSGIMTQTTLGEQSSLFSRGNSLYRLVKGCESWKVLLCYAQRRDNDWTALVQNCSRTALFSNDVAQLCAEHRRRWLDILYEINPSTSGINGSHRKVIDTMVDTSSMWKSLSYGTVHGSGNSGCCRRL